MHRLALLFNCLLLSCLLQAVPVPLFKSESPPASTADSKQNNKKTGKYYVDKIKMATACNNTTIFDQKIIKYLHAKKQCHPCLIIELAKNPEFLDRAIKNGLAIDYAEQKAIAASGNIEAFEVLKKQNIAVYSEVFWFSGNNKMAEYLANGEKPEITDIIFSLHPLHLTIHAYKYIYAHHPKKIAQAKTFLEQFNNPQFEWASPRSPAELELIPQQIKALNQLEKYITTAQESADVTPTTTS